MQISITFISKLRANKIFKVIETKEYSYTHEILTIGKATVSKVIQLEHEILDINSLCIGYYGIDFDSKLIVYKLK